MKIFNMVLFGWPYLPEDAPVGVPGSYPLSNKYFDPERGNVLLQQELDRIELSDELGLDGFTCQEHHGGGGFCALVPSTHVMAGVVSQRTKHMKVAVTGSCIPLHHPLMVAEEVAMLDHLSGGRFIWGALRGFPTEYLSYGVNPAESQGRFREGFALVIKALSTEGPFDFDGEYYRVRNYNIWPRPLQKPYPKIWMAANSLDSLDFAVQNRTYIATPWVSLDRTRYISETYRRLAGEQDIPVAEDFDDMFAAICAIYVGENDKKARLEAEAHLEYHFFRALASFDIGTVSLVPGHMSVAGMRDWLKNVTSQETGKAMGYSVDEGIENGTVILGGPDSVIAQIKRQRELGKRGTLLAMFQFGSLPDTLATQSLRLFASEVLPKIRDI